MLRLSEQERKDYLAKYAAKVFSEKGYQVASLQDIALRAKISKAGIYYYFKTKEDILAYVLIKTTDYVLIEMKERVKKNKEQNLNPEESLRQLIKAYAEFINKDINFRGIVLRERHQLTGKNKQELYRKEKSIFHMIKDELKKLKTVEKNIDLNVTSFLFIGMSHWLGYWFKENKRLALESIIEQNINIILRGITN